MAALDKGEHVFEARIVGPFARRYVHNDGDLIEFQPDFVEGPQPLGDVVQPNVSDAVVAQFLEHFGLLLQRSLLGVVPVDAEGEEGVSRRLAGVGHAE